jgi:hypothetical protein
MPAQNYERPAPQAYAYRPQTYPNRAQTYSNPGYASRPQAYANPGYGYNYANRSAQPNYAARPGYSYANPYSSYRAPQMNSHAYSAPSYEPRGNSMPRNQSGGFRGFSSHNQPSFSAPKYSYNAPRSNGGGGGGGHFSAPKAPSMSHSNGGGGHRRF